MDVVETNDEALLFNYVLTYYMFYTLEVDDLCLCNDFASRFIVDTFYDITSFKFNPRTSAGFTLCAVPNHVKLLLRDQLNLYCAGHRHAYEKIMKHASHYAHCCDFESDKLLNAALECVKLYLNTFKKDSDFRIEPSTYNYKGDGQLTSLRITAKKNFRPESGVADLLMFTKYVRDMPRRWENYSVNGNYVAVGPLMYANHSCQNNAEFVSHYTSDKRLRFVWVSSLSLQENREITVNYGAQYFSSMLCECEKCRPKLFSLAWFALSLEYRQNSIWLMLNNLNMRC